MRSKISSLVISGGEANSGLGRAEGPGGLQSGLGSLDHALVHGALREAHRVGDAGRR